MISKTDTPKSRIGSASSSAANSQSNGHLSESGAIPANHVETVTRKKSLDDDPFHMDSLVLLEKECQQTLSKIVLDPLSENAVNAEKQLWNSFIKHYKVHLNSYMANYLIGYYVTLSDTLFFSTPREDHFLKFNRCGFQLKQTNQELMYHIHIRIGDLYRYVDSRSNAKVYYHQALQIDPSRGIAYNQLALCTPLTKPYKLLYFSILASKSSVDPVRASHYNFSKALSRIDNPLFEKFRSDINMKRFEGALKVPEPETGAQWFYLSVISIYLNNFNHTLVALLDWLLDLTQRQVESVDLDYSLMALDIALDWILKDRDNLLKKDAIEQTLRLIGNQFKTTIKFDDGETNSKLKLSQKIALMHNFVLRNFLPLKDLYAKMIFYDEMQSFVVKRDRKILITKLIHKLRNF